MANHNASPSLLSHLCASPKSLQGPAPVCLQAGTAAGIVSLRLASPAIGAYLHLQRSLCLQGDADTDKDGAMNFLPRIGTGGEQWEPVAGGVSLRSEFIKDSSNMDELRVSSIL